MIKICAQAVYWQEPDESTVTSVEINRATDLYGTYSVIDTIDATSDGAAKSSSNTWVVTYTDTTGTRTHWYKVRFYDGTNYSEYSDPTTSEELLRMCNVDEIKRTINTVGRWTDNEIFEAITEVDGLIYVECGTPIQATVSPIGKIDTTEQDTYYVGEQNIHRIDRLFYGTTRKTEYYLDDGYKANLRYGMIRLLPVASGGPTLSTSDEIEIHYVPKIYNQLAIYRTAKRLLEELDFTSGGATSKELETIEKKLDKVETLLQHRVGLQLSSDLAYYDSIYGVNKRSIVQDHTRNRYLASTNW